MTAPIGLRCLGHSGLELAFGDARIVCDPWLSPHGAHLGNWQQFPDNSHIDARSLHDAPYLSISHPHQDHLDVETLRAFPKSVRVLIPRFPGGVMPRRLGALGFTNLVELDEWEPFTLDNGAVVRIVKDPTRYILDSCLVVEYEGRTVIDQNDCFLDASRLDRLAAMNPLVHITQFSGASYYPSVYQFSPAQMREHVERYTNLLFTRFCDVTRRVGAPYVVPSAGPPCFLDEHRALNHGGSIFYDTDELLRRLAEAAPDVLARVRPMYPGDRATLTEDGARFESRRPYDDKAAYLDAYRARRAPIIDADRRALREQATPFTARDLRAYFVDFFKYDDLTRGMDLLVKFELTDGPSQYVDFRQRPIRYLSECSDAPGYTIRLESAWMGHVMAGRLDWYDLLMSQQVQLHRDPDRYCVGLINHLYYRAVPELLELVRAQHLGDEMITVRDDKAEYECQRWCPHSGRDLAEGTVVDGVLTCPGHGWQFDLRDHGMCIRGGGQSVVVRTIRSLTEESS